MPFCFIEGCDSGTKVQLASDAGRKFSYFKARSDEMLLAWTKAIGSTKKVLSKNKRVCEKHFDDGEISREYVTKLLDGSEHQIKRDKPLLKKGAVPTKFPPKPAVHSPKVESAKERKEEFSYQGILENDECVPLPSFWMVKKSDMCIVWVYIHEDQNFSCRRIVLDSQMKISVFFGNKEINSAVIKGSSEIILALNVVSNLLPCCSAEFERSQECDGYVLPKEKSTHGPQTKYCSACKQFRKKMRKKNLQKLKKTYKSRVLKKKMRNRLIGVNRKNLRLNKKVKSLQKKVEKLRLKCATIDNKVVDEAISRLPPKQQMAVNACFAASKLNDIKGMRYTTQWIYECILLRIKSKKVYKQLRRDKILILPSPFTLSKYMRNIKSTYGFQDYVFKGLEIKTASMSPQDRHGIFAIDEVKLSEALSFDRVNLKVEGFTDLGEYTPESQERQRGDHALVVMFQPFRGNFVQTIGCFLSKGCATGTVLQKIILEGLALAEKAGLFVDAIVTDGAAWNRNMWKLFGVTQQRINISHPCNPRRRLWFLSDYPHLAKILRNFITKFSKFDVIFTPDGGISKKHWYALLTMIDEASYEIKINYKLRKEHIDPKYYQKMNVALAFQFFNVYEALEIFENQHEDLEDCAATKAFTKRISDLNKAMNSRTPATAMAPGNEAWDIIKNFLVYLKEWESKAKENNFDFLTENCCYGLKISLQATLEICEYLVTECGYHYMMTGRLNQDCVERFFGMMRECCGANDHPDSILFIQMYKLVSTYSLIKPPKGCNVEGSEILQALLSFDDVGNKNERKEHWEGIVDNILDKGSAANVLGEASRLLIDHNYTMSDTSDYALSYIAGYVSRRGERFAKYLIKKKPFACKGCLESLVLSPNDIIPERHKLIQLKSRGGLKHPSIQLYNLINVLENATMLTVKKMEINANTLLQIGRALEELSPIPLVGCGEHATLLTRRILIFYLTMRMFFICKQYNKNNNEAKEKSRKKRKAAKLTSHTNCNDRIIGDTSKNNCCDALKNLMFTKKSDKKRKKLAVSAKEPTDENINSSNPGKENERMTPFKKPRMAFSECTNFY